MKKFFFGAAIAASLFTINASAQQQEKMDSPERQAKQKEWMIQRLKDSVGLSEQKAAQVSEVQSTYGPKKMEILRDQTLNQSDKMSKLADIEAQMDTQLKTVLSEDELVKFHEFQKKGMNRMKGSERGPQGGMRQRSQEPQK